MNLKEASKRLEGKCQVQRLYVYEFQQGDQRHVLPVITEHVRTLLEYGLGGEYEFFRARATHPGAAYGTSFHTYHNQVSVTVCHSTKEVKFGPWGQLIMAERGIRLGPALMATVIDWLKTQKLSAYTIDSGWLSNADARTKTDQIQRNRFYLAFGFQLANFDKTKTGLDVVDGSFTAINVGALSVPTRYQNMLQPWKTFEYDLRSEREDGVRNLTELKLIDQWSYKKWCMKLLLKIWQRPFLFGTRHMHPVKPWEVKLPIPENGKDAN